MTTKEKVAAIRTELNNEFPEVKFSVRKKDYNGVSIDILSAPYALIDEDYEQVNHYYVNEHYEGKAKEVLSKVCEIAQKQVGGYRETSDYGSQPDFYINVSVGRWNKPFIQA